MYPTTKEDALHFGEHQKSNNNELVIKFFKPNIQKEEKIKTAPLCKGAV